MKKNTNYLLSLALGVCFLFSTNALQAQSAVHGGYLKNYWTNGYLFGGQDFGCMVNESGQPDADANAWTFEPLGKGWEGQKSTFRLKHTATGLYLHLQNGKLELGKIQKGWHSAMWVFEELEGLTATFRIKNFWKPTLYLNNEKVSKSNGVACTVSKDSFNSSYWVIEGDD